MPSSLAVEQAISMQDILSAKLAHLSDENFYTSMLMFLKWNRDHAAYLEDGITRTWKALKNEDT